MFRLKVKYLRYLISQGISNKNLSRIGLKIPQVKKLRISNKSVTVWLVGWWQAASCHSQHASSCCWIQSARTQTASCVSLESDGFSPGNKSPRIQEQVWLSSFEQCATTDRRYLGSFSVLFQLSASPDMVSYNADYG